MRMIDLIQKKKEGLSLSDEEISYFIREYTDGNIPDYQSSALLMAICFQSLSDDEIVSLTNAMARSGDQVDLSLFGDTSCDKHSTGGVGDKTSLVVLPIVAVAGGKMAKMSGRGLGHTGGTVDKLESIPGYNINLTPDDFIRQAERVGIALVGQSGNMTPADKKLYALRDVTATIESIGLIVSSIMSKKLAAGAKNIVLDVKVGSGAFMKTPEDAKVLARKMVEIGKRNHRNISAVLTNMDVPLGKNIGNALEVKEAVEILKNEGPSDLREVCLKLSSELISSLLSLSSEEAYQKADEILCSGKAFDKMKEWIQAQGGDVSYIESPEKFEKPAYSQDIISDSEGYIHHMDTESIGNSAVILGAGREKKEDLIDYSAGIILAKKTGDFVKKGDVLATLFTNRKESLITAEKVFRGAVTIRDNKPESSPLVLDIIR